MHPILHYLYDFLSFWTDEREQQDRGSVAVVHSFLLLRRVREYIFARLPLRLLYR